ncbi:hypothetical protein [Microbulbifer sp. VAAF005]|uniref:hypothetical protein n=1 Tax=Microbulbifer sp. VAAF005 TaxID=3034230 RepID=UPI0024ADF582|nr:hypothetical protein [Microbulbifer sp. VAAF005]WHI47332.1 hypothetical protein P0078_02830 [Microbulbifer sp. VAAF005]
MFNNPLSFTDPSGYEGDEVDSKKTVHPIDEGDSPGNGDSVVEGEVHTTGDGPNFGHGQTVFSGGQLGVISGGSYGAAQAAGAVGKKLKAESENKDSNDFDCNSKGGCVSITVELYTEKVISFCSDFMCTYKDNIVGGTARLAPRTLSEEQARNLTAMNTLQRGVKLLGELH